MNTNIIKQAEELKKKITDAVEEIRDSALYVNAIEENKDKLELALQGAGQTIYLDKIMSNEQMQEVMDCIMSRIAEAQADKETRLMMLLNPPKESNMEKDNTQNVSKSDTNCNTKSNEEAVIETPRTQIGTKKKPIPEDEEEAYLRIKYVNENLKVEDIAADLGVGKSWVYDRIKKYGLKAEKDGAPKWDPEEVKKMLKDNKTVKQIADYYGISKKEAYDKMTQASIAPSLYKQGLR